MIERAIEAQGLDFSIIAKGHAVASTKVVKPVLEILHYKECPPCVRVHTSYKGEKGSKEKTRLRQFLDAHFEVRFIDRDGPEIERRRYKTLLAKCDESLVPLFAINGGESHVVGFNDSESLITALTAKLPKPVPIRQSK